MEKKYLIVVIVLILVLIFVFRGKIWNGQQEGENGEEQEKEEQKSSIQASTGEIDYQGERREAIIQALKLYNDKKQEGMEFSSQCLGIVGENFKFAVDIVHVPRNSEDNKPENQCEYYREGIVRYFIELDKDGSIVRIV